MKFTKLIAASFAVLTMFSCSKEMTDVDQSMVKAGEARVVLNLNKGGQTTYATGTEEQAVKSLIYGVYNAVGELISVTDNGGGTTKVDFNVSASDYLALADKNVTLCILANSATTSAPATLTEFKAISESRNPNADVATNGLVAYKEVAINLEPNAVTNQTTVLERGVARFWVKAGGMQLDGTTANGRDQIRDAKVEIYSVSTSVIPSTKVGSGDLAMVNAYSYEITGATAPSNQFSNQEAAFYTYPTAAATAKIQVTLGGEMKEVAVANAIVANKNYSITITPKTVLGRQVIDAITIEEWNAVAGEDTEVNFNDQLKVKNGSLPGANGIEVINGTFTIPAEVTSATFNINDLVEGYDFTPSSGFIYNITFESKTRTLPSGFDINDIDPTVEITVPANYTATDYTGVELQVEVINSDSKVIETHRIPVTVKAQPIPAGFLVDMGGITFAAVDSRSTGKLSDDIAIFNTVNGSTTTGTFADKMVAYISANEAQYDAVVGPSKAAADAKCPQGFKMPSKADYKKLVENTFNFSSTTSTFTTTNPTHYNLGAHSTLESIMNGNRAVVTDNRKVGAFLTNLSTSGKQSYRRFDYMTSNTLIFAIQPLVTTYGGVRTSDGNIGINGNNASVTLYTEATVAGALQLRCVKDDAATNVMW